ncbi:MAG: 2-hydroxychromene-2-carboxylate isomerase [Henriciella sp.]|jgi:2-hydroxychromene-2-carboxylate isomerase|uniref:2-hydroxychromene-2-carboxylate isomerase n=1 Tax=Henriciella sp. TaxID=1968823 RepID=UPI000C0F0A0C|nr:2-hydroxychromene-2-carboxylate isomerase [Henriciella sp.]MAN75149.1 2-hydroxychromene-2-carboxylate isomerase [Henriciella sp.]MBF33654.1 2-hydroxychromene-2-carboxylate isomerase [Hyphomonadaceae bacterium]PHR69862.1 MAG: 2-hydroxychromene-2-carboxylate isomerase [Henriciella sp.]|tara:strand:- start:56 stop:661 length:606 start_codon:yes stop_codon:yes gene_type:complete
MSAKLEFYFDFISPFSYVAYHALPHELGDLSDRVEFRPLFLGAVMQTTGNRPPGLVPAKGKYMQRDLQRCCARYGIEFRMNPHFPMMNTRPMLRAAIGLADDADTQKRFIETIFHHVWRAEEPLKTDDLEQVRAICASAGFDADRILGLAESEETKARLKANTDSAIERGAFGAPSFFVEDELFFGHDRLDYAREALIAAG